MAANLIRIDDPFHPHVSRRMEQIEAGATLRALVGIVSQPTIVLVNGDALLRADWSRAVAEGDLVAIVTLPQGGEGGGSNPLRMIAMMVVMYFAPYLGGELALMTAESSFLATGALTSASAMATMGSIYSTGIAFAGMALVNALIPPPKLPSNLGQQALAAPSPTYNIQAQGNSARIGGAIPAHYGALPIFPDYAAQPYWEYSGNDQFLYLLMVIGLGEYDISDIHIADVSISAFPEVTYEIASPGQIQHLYPGEVHTASTVTGQALACSAAVYACSGTTLTGTLADHGLATGQVVYLEFATGGISHSSDGDYTITGVSYDPAGPASSGSNKFTATIASGAAAEGTVNISQWVGGFPANPAETRVSDIGIDLVCPQGIYHVDDSGALTALSVDVTVQARPIDQSGVATASWTNLVSNDYYTNWGDWTPVSAVSYSQKVISVSSNTAILDWVGSGLAIGDKVLVATTQTQNSDRPSAVCTVTAVSGTSVTVINTTSVAFSQIVSDWNVALVAPLHGFNDDTLTQYQFSDYASPDNYYFVVSLPEARIARRTRTISQSSNITVSGSTTTAIRNSYSYTTNSLTGSQPWPRLEIRCRRVTPSSTDTRDQASVVWSGLRAYGAATAPLQGVTVMAMRMRATGSLSSQASRQVKVTATRKLPIWNGTVWSAPTATRSIAWALADILRNTDYGAGYADYRIGLDNLLALDSTWAARGDHFDGRFDSQITSWEALVKTAQVGRAKPYTQGGVVHIVRDQAVTVPVGMFSQRNITKGSFSIDYLMPTDATADCVEATYFDTVTMTPRTVIGKLPDSAAMMPAKIDLTLGCTDREQAHREAVYQAACNRYRRRLPKFSTEMEGLIPAPGDLIAVQHDMPAWGQSAESVSWNSSSHTLVVSEPLVWTGSGPFYASLRVRDGSVDGPHQVTRGANDSTMVFGSAPVITPYTDTGEERTHITFGWADTWRQPCRVISMTPRSLYQAELQVVCEDYRVHTADQGVFAPPATYSQLDTQLATQAMGSVIANVVAGDKNSVSLSWTAVTGATSYVVDVAQSLDGPWERATSTTATDTSIAPPWGNTTLIRVTPMGTVAGIPTILSTPDQPAPATPTALTAVGGTFLVSLGWTYGSAGLYDIAYTEVWAATTNDRASAICLSSVRLAKSWVHTGLQPGQSWYYWIRAVDAYGNVSNYYPASSTGGIAASPSANPSALLTQLNNSINASQLAAGLAGRIDLIDTAGPPDMLGGMADTLRSYAGTMAIMNRDLNGIGYDDVLAALQMQRTSETLAKAGVVVDQLTGAVTISGLVQTADSLKAAKLRISAAEGLIATKVSASDVYTAISNAKLDPANLPALGDLQQRVTTVESAVENTAQTLNTALQAEAVTRQNLAARLTVAEGTVATSSAAIGAESDVRAQADTAEAIERGLLASYLYDTTSGLASKASTAYVDSTESTLSGAITSASTTLSSAFAAGDASTLASANGHADTAAATAYANAQAYITTNYYSKTAADSAISSASTTLSASITTAQGTANTAVTNAAAAQTTANAAVTASTANATTSTTIQARLDSGDYAAVKASASSSASAITGLQANYVLKVDTNGHVAGMELASGSTGTSVTFLADKFLICKPDGSGTPKPVLSLQTVNGSTSLGLDGNLIADGTIYANAIRAGAITADKITADSLSTIKADLGTVTAGRAQNSLNTNYIDFNATGSNPFLKVGSEISLNADGSGVFARSVLSAPNQIFYHQYSGLSLRAGFEYLFATNLSYTTALRLLDVAVVPVNLSGSFSGLYTISSRIVTTGQCGAGYSWDTPYPYSISTMYFDPPSQPYDTIYDPWNGNNQVVNPRVYIAVRFDPVVGVIASFAVNTLDIYLFQG